MLSAFYHWVWCELWICHLWPLLCWGRFPLYPLSENFIFNHKWIKCLEINLPKEAKDLYSENYEDDINRCKDILCSWIGKINIVKHDHTTQGNLQIQWNPYQNNNDIFHRTKNNSKICMETQKIPNSQNNHDKEQSCSYHSPWFQNVLQSFSSQNSMTLAQKYTL